LLTHTSGLIDGYGLSGVLLSEKLQTIEEWLSMPKDANMGQSHPTTVTLKPGTAMSYSTAGYGVLQLLIEETTGKPFSIYMKEAILEPLGMSRSNYDVDAIIAEGRMEVLAANYDLELKVHPVRHYANKAGASLRSTLHDLCVFATSYFKENSFLNKKTMKLMLTPQPATYLTWTLGHTVYGKYNNEGYIVGHGGGSFPASGAEMRLNPATGNGIIIIGSGTQNLISELTEVWTYWETGKKEFDVRKVYQNRLWHIIIAIVVGAIAIIVWEVVLKRKKTVPTLK
jgi:CubicO group peptidase (beta-lactamase class C family)